MKTAFENDLHYKYKDMILKLKNNMPQSYNFNENLNWVYFFSTNVLLPEQGWKIHISVVPAHSFEMISNVSKYCFDHNLNWKILSTYKFVERNTYGGVSLPQTGKIVTIYISDAELLESHLNSLHRLTYNFIGPKIPTDKQFKENSCVFYRYGGFSNNYFYDTYNSVKKDAIFNGGILVEDKRLPGRYKPDWIQLPFQQSHNNNEDKNEINEFLVRGLGIKKVLKQSGKGGVYLANTTNYGECLLKEGRENILFDREKRTVKDRLQNEFNILNKIEHLAVAPKPYELFNYKGNTYLSTEFISGKSLRGFVEDMHHTGDYNYEMINKLIENILKSVKLIHECNIVLRDLSPNNIIVKENLEVKIIDLELAIDLERDVTPFTGFTVGYIPLSSETSWRNDKLFDNFSLGAICFFITTSLDPYFELESNDELIYKLKSYLNSINDFSLKELGYKGMKMMEDSLFKLNYKTSNNYIPTSNFDTFNRNQVIDNVKRIINKLYSEADFSRNNGLIKQNSLAQSFHESSFNYGLSGIVQFLLESYDIIKEKKIINFASEILTWILQKKPYKKGFTPFGLYFGYGYIPELLVEVYKRTNSHNFLVEAKNIMERICVENMYQYNISHGSAGIGLTLLNLYKNTNDDFYIEQAIKMGEHIINGAERKENLILWKVLDSSKGKGEYYPLGYSHGIAGIGYFLAGLYNETKDKVYSRLVSEIITTLKATSIENKSSNGLLWGNSIDSESKNWVFWCNGSGGIAKFLLLVDRLDIDNRSTGLAEKAINALLDSKVYGSNCQCHGLAGNGDICIDAYRTFKKDKIREKIDEYIGLLGSLSIQQENIHLWTIEDKITFSPDYMTGYLGIYSFLLRNHFNIPQALSLAFDYEVSILPS